MSVFSQVYATVNIETQQNALTTRESLQTLTLGLEVLTGNSEYNAYNIEYKLNRTRKKLNIITILNRKKKSNDNTKISESNFGHIRIQKPIYPHLYIENFYQYEYDPFKDLESRILVGLGIRKNIKPSAPSQTYRFQVGTGIMQETESTTTSKTTDIRSSSYINYANTFNDKTVKVITYFQPKISNFSDFRALAEASLTNKLYKQISLVSKIKVNIDKNPPIGIKESDLSIHHAITINF